MVKAGDIVKVKVLEVDVARRRIALTRRLDDEPGQAAPRPGERDAARRDAGRPGAPRDARGTDRNRGGGGNARPAQQAAPFNSAMADALKGLRRN